VVLGHANDEHRDFEVLESDYVATAGRLEVIRQQPRNIGSEALKRLPHVSSWRTESCGLFGSHVDHRGIGEKMQQLGQTRVEELHRCQAQLHTIPALPCEQRDSHMNKLYGLLTEICTHQQVWPTMCLELQTLSVAYTRCSSRKLTCTIAKPGLEVLTPSAGNRTHTPIPIPGRGQSMLPTPTIPCAGTVRPLLQFIFGMLLHITWLFKATNRFPRFGPMDYSSERSAGFAAMRLSRGELLILRHLRRNPTLSIST